MEDHSTRGDSAPILLAETPAEREERPISLPRAPRELPSSPFPWLMMLTPAALGVGLVVMTGSSFALMFAAIGPLLALGSVVDHAVQRRATYRREDEQFDRAIREATADIAKRAARERARRLARHPPVAAIVNGEVAPVATAPDDDVGATVALGTTSVPSGIRLDATDVAEDRRLADLVESARVIDGVPYVETVRACAIAGPHERAVGAAFALLIDLAARRPAGVELRLGGSIAHRVVAAEILRTGLHGERAIVVAASAAREGRPAGPKTRPSTGPISRPGDAGRVRFQLTLVDHATSAPAGTDVVLDLSDPASATVRSAGGDTRVTPQLVESADFQRWARHHLESRRRRGFSAPPARTLPDRIELDGILRSRPPAAARSPGAHLAATIGVDEAGPVWVDLVADGPHAVIGGTTGTGKSELLRSWIAGLAARYPATHVAFLCLDFKGGATFDAIAALPHCVGVVTDLDGGEAVRVLAGLRAELRRRERELRRLGVRDVSALEAGRLERLVVVVDEFQALIDEHHDLHDVFADLAARGRSLGIHLVLCAQRPAGAARESLLANCTIRLSLRVTNPVDSQAVIGTTHAADLPTEPRGRGILVQAGELRTIQVATLSDELLAATRTRRTRELADAGSRGPTAPWLPPLPHALPLEVFDWLVRGSHASATSEAGRTGGGVGAPLASSVPIALLDDPDRQRQAPLDVDPRGGGHLLLLGPSGSGKSTALASIAELLERAGVTCTRLPADAEGAWDAVAALRRAPDEPTVLLVDDLDQRGIAFGDEHRHAWLGMLADAAKLGGSGGLTLVASAARTTSDLSPFVGLAREVVRLGSPPRHEFVLSGGEVSDYRAGLTPGRGVARGLLVQFPLPAGAGGREIAPSVAPPPLDLLRLAEYGAAIVTRRPLRRVAQLSAAGVASAPVPKPGAPSGHDPQAGGTGRPRVTVGEPDLWQQSFGALGRFAAVTEVVFDDVPPSALRSLLPGEPLPPHIADPSRVVLVREPGGELRRFAWPCRNE
ncbi:hypothetical protein GCM10011490_06060 [Pseudoclavibacter endophyticus]|nr:FtsK/SpoIIIE domain-containing protein [Pseudoclavibacter endophyticus]GGA58868.1 hypothetical protein GCM10011490_06060 [Pseudoclavibacter endophyticus]